MTSRRRQRRSDRKDDLAGLVFLLVALVIFVPAFRVLAVGAAAALIIYLFIRSRSTARAPSVVVAPFPPPPARSAPLPLGTGTVRPALAQTPSHSVRLPYRARRTFFNWSESAFYAALVTAVAGRYIIFAKVRLLDVCEDLERGELAAFNRISSKHLDFLLCDPVTYRPRAGIELDGSSHWRSDRMARDAFVDEVFRGMNVPLIHFHVERTFLPQQIAERIRETVGVDSSSTRRY